jgi:hypothetical protein
MPTETPARIRVSAPDLRALVTGIFAARGVHPADAAAVADALVWANLRGADSHGSPGCRGTSSCSTRASPPRTRCPRSSGRGPRWPPWTRTPRPARWRRPAARRGPQGSRDEPGLRAARQRPGRQPDRAAFHAGDAAGRRHRQNGFVLAVDVSAVLPLAEFTAGVDETVDAIKALPRAYGVAEALIPGERGRRSELDRLSSGVPLGPGSGASSPPWPPPSALPYRPPRGFDPG